MPNQGIHTFSGGSLSKISLDLDLDHSDFSATGSGGVEYVHTLLEEVDPSNTIVLLRNKDQQNAIANIVQLVDSTTIRLAGLSVSASFNALTRYVIDIISGYRDVKHHVITETAGANTIANRTITSNLIENLDDRDSYIPILSGAGRFFYDRWRGTARTGALYDLRLVDNAGVDAVFLSFQTVSVGGSTHIPIQLVKV